ncbi:MAG: VOC family protein [Pseudomonadota bacterium]
MSAPLGPAAPFLIVRDVSATVAFYRDGLGFHVSHLAPEEAPFFAVIERGSARILLKAVEVAPLPNPVRDPDARWDVFLSASDPDALAAEFLGRDVAFAAPLADTDDGLRGFEISDPDGHVLFFGRPL